MRNSLWLPAMLSQTSQLEDRIPPGLEICMPTPPPTAGLACLQQEERHLLLCQLWLAGLHPLHSSPSDLDYFPFGWWIQRPFLKVSPRSFELSIGLISWWGLSTHYCAQNLARSYENGSLCASSSSLITLPSHSLHDVALEHLCQPQFQ